MSDSTFGIIQSAQDTQEKADAFASSLCVTDGDKNTNALDFQDYTGAALFDLNNKNVIFAQNIYTQLYPASLTKVMTAIVALENSSPDQILTAGSDVNNMESGAQVAGISPGDTLTMDQALHLLLVYSANDAAIVIADSVAGSIDSFVDMMNAEAASLGATGTNFKNSNGLHDENHYTTPYDMYLIFNKALTYDLFKEIINTSTYDTIFHDSAGEEKEIHVSSTNLYLTGSRNVPTGISVIGGKTGTTSAAGHCLVLLVRDSFGNPYIAVVMKALNQDTMYEDMNDLLSLIPN